VALLEDGFAVGFVRATDADAARILRERWGIEPTGLEPVDTERDDTFRVAADAGTFGLKLAHPADDPAVVDFTTAVVDHALARDPGLPVPAWQPDRDGRTQPHVELGGETRIARLMQWLPGTRLRDAPRTSAVLTNLGETQARLTAALADFAHPADGRELVWDVQHASGLRPLIAPLDDPVARRLTTSTLDAFDAVAPRLAALPRQVVHNDANLDNVLVDGERVTAILDFGDIARTPRVVDLAVSISYLLPTDASDAAPWGEVLAGYRRVLPLADAELAVLPTLVRARLAQRILLNAWIARARPENGDYAARNDAITLAQLADFRWEP